MAYGSVNVPGVSAPDFKAHTENKNNPHSVTKAQVGLGNADNTSDADKPVSTAVQTALNGKSDTSHTHTAAQVGAVPTSRTVNGKALSSNITLSASDVGLGNVNNTSDANKPISTATQTALNKKANTSHTHAATDITQDSSHRFAMDSEKAIWNAKSNPNLLDNWYFADFIDQRGKSKEILNGVLERIYQSAGVPMSNYWVCDRWRYQCLSNVNHVMYFNDKYRYKGVPVPYFSGLLNDGLHQFFEKKLERECWYTLSVFGISTATSSIKYPDMDTYVNSSGAAYNYMPQLRTASVYINANGSGGYFNYKKYNGSAPSASTDLTASFIEPGTVNEYIGFIADNVVYPELAWFPSYTTVRTDNLAVIAIKLEKGQKQTLVTNNSDGRMILNDPPPNKASELLKCQRYYFKTTTNNYYSGSLYANNAGVFLIPVPIQMRVNPSVNILRKDNVDYNGTRRNGNNITSINALADSNAVKLVLAFEQAFTGIGLAVLADWDFEFSAEF